ncbi:Mu-like prophage protein gp45 [Chromobacterium violaceum]|uniref:Mu-like prophage protein gp45 n=1 Tax=Chromobacterium violaceum TaxID=536 RepID=A0A447T5D6_CHRVL|nr:Mu-like prophage protein gp45 [Chromobacterium violaceum]
MWHEVDQRIRRAFSNVRQGFRAVLTHVDSDGGVQAAQADALAGERLQDAELFQHYGYTSNPRRAAWRWCCRWAAAPATAW